MAKKTGVTGFHFSFQNFEDFWAMHLDDERFHAWLRMMDGEKHWTAPLHSDVYLPLFQHIVPGYEKGKLEDTDLAIDRLNNMRKHVLDIKRLATQIMPQSSYLFVEFLSKTLKQFYPTVFP